MTLRELSQLYWLGKEIEVERERLARLREQLAAPLAPVLSDMPKAHGWENRTERIAAEIVDIEAMIADKLAQCVCERARLERYIAGIPDSLTRQIFTLRFIHGMSWPRVAFSIGGISPDAARMICYRYIKNPHG